MLGLLFYVYISNYISELMLFCVIPKTPLLLGGLPLCRGCSQRNASPIDRALLQWELNSFKYV